MERSHNMFQSFRSLSLSATSLDLGREFAIDKTPQQFVAIVNQYLKLNTGDNLHKFRLFFCPFDEFLQDIEQWIEFAVAKRVEELELDLSMDSDPYTESSEPEHDYIKLLLDLSHAKVLTLCTATLWRFAIYEDIDAECLPIMLHNLTELQLLMNSLCNEDLECIYTFFRLCPSPFIEKLFIQLPTIPEIPGHTCHVIRTLEEPLGVVFNHLKVIKLSNFNGCATEMRLVRFLLERAVVLETLVLVTSQKLDVSMDEEQSSRLVLEAHLERRVGLTKMWGQLALLSKASAAATIVLYEYMEDDGSINPTHTEYFCEF